MRFYLMRQEQHYADSTSETRHVTTSGGTIVEFDLRDVSPGTQVTGAFDHSEIDSRDRLNLDLGVHSRTTASVVASHLVDRGALHFAVEGAGSYTNDFDAAVTGAIAAALVSDPWRVWVSWGRSYRAPTMNELYWPEDAWSGGNEDLEPESVSTLEAGAEGRVGDVTATVTAYRSDATDLIGWAVSAADGKYYPVNVGEADVRGVELDFRSELGPVQIQYAVSYATSEDADSGFALPYRPEASQWFSVSAETGRLSGQLRMRSASRVYADTFEHDRLSGYGLVDLTALLELPWEGTALRFEGLNITDEHYRTRQYYDMPGSEWRLSLLLGWEDDV
ncbi:MAG: TonB-dependent receptor [Candidatus Eisenbacteria bacterium]